MDLLMDRGSLGGGLERWGASPFVFLQRCACLSVSNPLTDPAAEGPCRPQIPPAATPPHSNATLLSCSGAFLAAPEPVRAAVGNPPSQAGAERCAGAAAAAMTEGASTDETRWEILDDTAATARPEASRANPCHALDIALLEILVNSTDPPRLRMSNWWSHGHRDWSHSCKGPSKKGVAAQNFTCDPRSTKPNHVRQSLSLSSTVLP